MTLKEIQELIKLVSKSDLSEFKMKDGEFELSIRTRHYEKNWASAPALPSAPVAPVVAMPAVQPVASTPPPTPAKPAVEENSAPPASSGAEGGESGYLQIKSPIVGTFYRSSSPEKPPYVKVGDVIEVGAVVCIVEAMKLFNEIESEFAGRIVKVMVEDAQPVEYDQVLYLLDPKG